MPSRTGVDILRLSLPEEGFVHGQALQLAQRGGQRGAEQQRLPACWNSLQDHLQVGCEVSAALLEQPVGFVQNLGSAKNKRGQPRTHPYAAGRFEKRRKEVSKGALPRTSAFSG